MKIREEKRVPEIVKFKSLNRGDVFEFDDYNGERIICIKFENVTNNQVEQCALSLLDGSRFGVGADALVEKLNVELIIHR